MKNNNKDLGCLGERCAKEYMEKKGFKELVHNYHSRYGEVDIILEDEKYIVFVEVKSRGAKKMFSGAEAVDINKRVKIIKTALMFLSNNVTAKQPRFDVIEVRLSPSGKAKVIKHYENAFDGDEYDAFF